MINSKKLIRAFFDCLIIEFQVNFFRFEIRLDIAASKHSFGFTKNFLEKSS